MKQTKAVFVVHLKQRFFLQTREREKKRTKKNRQTNRSRDIEKYRAKTDILKTEAQKDRDIKGQKHKKTKTWTDRDIEDRDIERYRH